MHLEKVGAFRAIRTEKVAAFRANKTQKVGLYRGTYPYCFNMGVPPGVIFMFRKSPNECAFIFIFTSKGARWVKATKKAL